MSVARRGALSLALLSLVVQAGCGRCGTTYWSEGSVELRILETEPSGLETSIELDSSSTDGDLEVCSLGINRQDGRRGRVSGQAIVEDFGLECVGDRAVASFGMSMGLDQDGQVIERSIDGPSVLLLTEDFDERASVLYDFVPEDLDVEVEATEPFEGRVRVHGVEWEFYGDCEGQSLQTDLELRWSFDPDSKEQVRQFCSMPTVPCC